MEDEVRDLVNLIDKKTRNYDNDERATLFEGIANDLIIMSSEARMAELGFGEGNLV